MVPLVARKGPVAWFRLKSPWWGLLGLCCWCAGYYVWRDRSGSNEYHHRGGDRFQYGRCHRCVHFNLPRRARGGYDGLARRPWARQVVNTLRLCQAGVSAPRPFSL